MLRTEKSQYHEGIRAKTFEKYLIDGVHANLGLVVCQPYEYRRLISANVFESSAILAPSVPLHGTRRRSSFRRCSTLNVNATILVGGGGLTNQLPVNHFDVQSALRDLPEGLADGVRFPGWCEALAALTTATFWSCLSDLRSTETTRCCMNRRQLMNSNETGDKTTVVNNRAQSRLERRCLTNTVRELTSLSRCSDRRL